MRDPLYNKENVEITKVGVNLGDDDEILYDIVENKLEDYIFNLMITIEALLFISQYVAALEIFVLNISIYMYTVMILSFRMDRSGLTVNTQMLEEQSDKLYTVSHIVCIFGPIRGHPVKFGHAVKFGHDRLYLV